MELKDYGKQPFVINMENFTKSNTNFRTAVWTGEHLQMTLMSIAVGSDIGGEIHEDNDQFLRVEQGRALVKMGNSETEISFEQVAEEDAGIFIPVGNWHNVINIGDQPLKLYSIYAPVHHPFGTVHTTRAEADEAEDHQ